MTAEIAMLVYATALLFILVVIQDIAGILSQGLVTMAGSRDNLGEPGVFEARTKRLVDNHREGLLMFAPLVIATALTGISTELTVLGAQLFFYSRVAHAVAYLSGVPWLRPAFWLIGIAGCVIIFIELLGA